MSGIIQFCIIAMFVLASWWWYIDHKYLRDRRREAKRMSVPHSAIGAVSFVPAENAKKPSNRLLRRRLAQRPVRAHQYRLCNDLRSIDSSYRNAGREVRSTHTSRRCPPTRS